MEMCTKPCGNGEFVSKFVSRYLKLFSLLDVCPIYICLLHFVGAVKYITKKIIDITKFLQLFTCRLVLKTWDLRNDSGQ